MSDITRLLISFSLSLSLSLLDARQDMARGTGGISCAAYNRRPLHGDTYRVPASLFERLKMMADTSCRYAVFIAKMIYLMAMGIVSLEMADGLPDMVFPTLTKIHGQVRL